MTAVLPPAPPAADDAPPEAEAGLFGAAPVRPGRWTPGLLVDLVGHTVGSTLTDGHPLVVDGVDVTWGRTDVLTQPDPATARLSLFDATATWALQTNLVGLQVRLAFRGTPPSVDGAQDGVTGTTFQREMFRGRVQTVKVVPTTVLHPTTGEEVHGSLVHLTLSSILNDLANRTPTVAWPNESLGARATRIAADATDVLPGSVLVREFWKTPAVAPVTVGDQVSIYEHLVSLFDSCGCDRLTFYPSIGRVEFAPRREYGTSVRGLGELWWDVTGSGLDRAAQGVYIRARPTFVEDASVTAEMWPIYLDADDVEFRDGDGIIRGPGANITRIDVPHPDSAAGYEMTAGQVIVGNEATVGIRAMRIESIVAFNSWADLACQDLASFVTKEGAAWSTDPLRFSTRRAGGFSSLAQAIWMLSGAEIPSAAFIAGSDIHARYGLRPIVGLMGGQITYRDGDWDVELYPSPVTTKAKQHAITWEEVDNGSATYEIRWDDSGVRSFHESVTYEDLGWVSNGLARNNAADTGPDQGWDFYA